jgi:S-adenosylmethionine:tRNA ribosyltransferase-isomerase
MPARDGHESALALADLRDAHEPPEASGRGRDDVAMLVSDRRHGSFEHRSFRDLPNVLRAGDLLVVNTSATLAASLPATLAGRPLELRLSTRLKANVWVVELRNEDGTPLRPPPVPARLDLPDGAHADLGLPFGDGRRLALARLELDAPYEQYLRRHGHPIRYRHVRTAFPIEAYQTVFALHPGSAEMPSAGPPFTGSLVTELVSRGILVAPITLHAGVSSPELGEPPYLERFHVPETTGWLVGAVHAQRGRVVAVGTTVVRALETAASPDGAVSAGDGWTNLVISPETGIRVIDGLLTGWHEPRSSHLQILEAVAGPSSSLAPIGKRTPAATAGTSSATFI